MLGFYAFFRKWGVHSTTIDGDIDQIYHMSGGTTEAACVAMWLGLGLGGSRFLYEERKAHIFLYLRTRSVAE